MLSYAIQAIAISSGLAIIVFIVGQCVLASVDPIDKKLMNIGWNGLFISFLIMLVALYFL